MLIALIVANLAVLGLVYWCMLFHFRRQARRYHTLQENAGDAVVVIGSNGQLKYASKSIKKVLGYTASEMQHLDISSLAHPEDTDALLLIMQKVMSSPGVPVTGHTGRMLHGDGSWHWYEAVVTNMLHDRDIRGIVDNFRDVTQTILAQEKIRGADRLYGFISQINQAIVQTLTEEELFAQTCRIATEFGNFKMAWIGIYSADGSNVSLAEGNGIPDDEKDLFAPAQVGPGDPLAQVLSTGSSYVCNNIKGFRHQLWQAFADRQGIGSFMVLPIRREGVTVAALSLYSGTEGFFNKQEIGLLEEVAGDISFALSAFKRERSRERAETQLRNSERRLKQAQMIANVGSFEIDFSTGMASWSEELCRIYGFGLEENLHPFQGWLQLVHPEDLAHVMQVSEQARASLQDSAIYHRIIRRDGSVRHLFSQGEYELDGEGLPVGMHGAVHDITMFKESEGARSQSEQNLQLIMDLIPQCIFIKDILGRYRFVNESFAALYGVSAAEFLEDDSHQRIEMEQERNHFLQQDRQVIQGGQTLTIPEAIFTSADGRVSYFYMVKVPYKLEDGGQTGMLGIALDITEQKQAELERTRLMGDLIKRNKELEQFSYVVSHNVRAPLVNIISLISLLDPLGICEDVQVLSALRESTDKLDSVILDLNSILNMNHEFTESTELVDLSAIVFDIKLSIAHLISSSRVRILEDFSSVAQVQSIKSYVHSIFYNLILNAIKYRRSDVLPEIRLSSSIANGMLVLEFADNGLGIDLGRYGEDIFGLYKRFHPGIEGKGMGLYMVKNQVGQLGGQISVSSQEGMGTTFTVRLAMGE